MGESVGKSSRHQPAENDRATRKVPCAKRNVKGVLDAAGDLTEVVKHLEVMRRMRFRILIERSNVRSSAAR